MSSKQPFVFKIAAEDWEFEKIHKLNYQTFVKEIPQHEDDASQMLVDKYHDENVYIICFRVPDMMPRSYF